jgi:hypothetical protein
LLDPLKDPNQTPNDAFSGEVGTIDGGAHSLSDQRFVVRRREGCP